MYVIETVGGGGGHFIPKKKGYWYFIRLFRTKGKLNLPSIDSLLRVVMEAVKWRLA